MTPCRPAKVKTLASPNLSERRSEEGGVREAWMDGWMDGWLDGWMVGYEECHIR